MYCTEIMTGICFKKSFIYIDCEYGIDGQNGHKERKAC